MSNILRSIQGFEGRLGASALLIARNHPYLSFWPIFVGIPACVVAAVTVATAAAILPIAWICGWL